MTFDLLTERRVLIEADSEDAALEIARQNLGIASCREGYSKRGKFLMKSYPGAVKSIQEIQLKADRIYDEFKTDRS